MESTTSSGRGSFALIDLVLNQLAEAAYLVDESGGVRYVNDEACRMLGYGREELLGLSEGDAFPDVVVDWRETWHRIQTQALTLKGRQRTKGGHSFPVEIKTSRFDHEGASYVLCLVRDITERRANEAPIGQQAERDAQPQKGAEPSTCQVTDRRMCEKTSCAREAHYRDIFENSPDGLYLLEVTEDGRFRNLDINTALARSVGVQAADLIGRYVDEPVSEEAAQAVIAKYRRCVEAGQRIEEELKLELPVGDYWYHSTLMPVRDATGRIHRIVGMSRDITKQKHMELALRDSEQRYRDIFDNTLESVFLLEVTENRQFRTLEINPAFERSTGVTREMTVGRLIEEVMPESMASVINAKYTRAVESGTVYEEEVELDLPVGRRFFHSTLIPVRDALGRIYRLTGITRDITEKRLMEAALAKSEREFRTLAENLPDNVIRYDVAGNVIYMNPMLTKTLGIEAEDYVGTRMPKAKWSEDFDLIIMGETAPNVPEEVKISLVVPDGAERIHLVRFVTERDARGNKTGTLALGRDITDMERAAALLHERSEALRAVVENSPDFISRYDRYGRRIYVNPAMERLFGRSAEELVGLRVDEDSPIVKSAEYPKLIRQVFEGREELQKEMPFRSEEGEMRWVHMRVVPEFGPDGEVATVLGLGRDITGIKETEWRLEESRTELIELAARRETVREEERKRIAREMHDELGQMLMALRLDISVAEHLARGKPLLEQKIGQMMALVDRTSRVVRQLVAALRPAALDMGLISALEWLASDFKEHTGVECKIRVGDCDVSFDEERSVTMFRIVQESLTNIARHAQASKVVITLERRGAKYRLEVRDDGCGFDPGLQRKNSFGLVGIRERASALGGTATITSVPGIGTVVEVIIPAQYERGFSDDQFVAR